MDQVFSAILAVIPNVGDVTTYEVLYEALPAENRGNLPDALRELKRMGTISKGVFFEDGVNHYRIKREVA
jgi:hypothetical protein